jgi:ATP diphosphatase
MARLRDPQGGCPWDVEQTFATIAPYTVEEAYEVADAIDRKDLHGLRDELGDLLLQVVFHARMAEEQGAFAFGDVVAAICDKMVRRHPHVFADAQVGDATAQTIAWEEHKKRERDAAGHEDTSALAGIARGMPEWQRAVKLQHKAAKVGFDWPGPAPVIDKLHEEIDEVRAEFAAVAADPGDGAARERLEDELGDLLFVCANLARHAKVDVGQCVAPRQPEVRTALPPHGSAGGGGGRGARVAAARGAGCVLEPRQGRGAQVTGSRK